LSASKPTTCAFKGDERNSIRRRQDKLSERWPGMPPAN
jgi:hypothetical protein